MSCAAARVSVVPFRIPRERRLLRAQAFDQRPEVAAFGLQGRYDDDSDAVVGFTSISACALGGGGVEALNGGAIAAGFDAACVLAGLAQFDADVVVTLSLHVQFLRLAHACPGLEFRAQVTRSSSRFCFVQAQLRDRHDPAALTLATAVATLAPR